MAIEDETAAEPTPRQQAFLQVTLLTVVLLLINRFVRGLAWDLALFRSVLFAVPFTLIFIGFTALKERWRNR
jgi:hypothetical protein